MWKFAKDRISSRHHNLEEKSRFLGHNLLLFRNVLIKAEMSAFAKTIKVDNSKNQRSTFSNFMNKHGTKTNIFEATRKRKLKEREREKWREWRWRGMNVEWKYLSLLKNLAYDVRLLFWTRHKKLRFKLSLVFTFYTLHARWCLCLFFARVIIKRVLRKF